VESPRTGRLDTARREAIGWIAIIQGGIALSRESHRLDKPHIRSRLDKPRIVRTGRTNQNFKYYFYTLSIIWCRNSSVDSGTKFRV
jgi:hypothetical protein